ncbi:MAG: leucine-rich repeat domain-containing protein [Oscillospiraceae bacterium]|nr:leucine-rich repeat domain-containing protein [Oscillospiraceae bacterium]
MKDIKSIMKAALEADTAHHPAIGADMTFVIGDIRYRLSEDNTVDMVSYLGDEETVHVPGKVLVPGEAEESQVRCVMLGSFMGKDNVRRVVLEEGIEHLIGGFMMCHTLETVHLPASLKLTHGGAVRSCSSFRGFTISSENPVYEAKDGFLVQKDNHELVSGPHHLTECVIPEGIERIGDFAFEYCYSMESVTIPEGVREIGICAFANNPMLWDVQLPASLENICEEAFYGCPRLTELAVPAGVTFDGSPERDFSMILGSYTD